LGFATAPQDKKPKQSTEKKLYGLSLNQCSNPDCEQIVIARDKTNIGEVAHIEGEKPNAARYNPNMAPEDRRHYNNLILLCSPCHTTIDNEENIVRYPVSLLKSWKGGHENKALQHFVSDISPLKIAVNAIANFDFQENPNIKESENLNPYEINIKISHNHLKKNKHLIEKYRIFYSQINSLYTELESQNSFKKNRLLRNINMVYDKVKSEYVAGRDNELEIVRECADEIFESVENKLLELVVQNDQYNDNIYYAVPIIMVDAFIKCKILEEPS